MYSNTQVVDIQTKLKKIQSCVKVWSGFKVDAQMTLHMHHLYWRKYHKHLSHSQIQKGILTRHFFDVFRNISYQVCIPKHLRQELLYRINNSPTGGRIGLVRTTQEFRIRFYFPGFTEFLMDYIKNSPIFDAEKSQQKTMESLLQPVSSREIWFKFIWLVPRNRRLEITLSQTFMSSQNTLFRFG